MRLSECLSPGGAGIIATADRSGVINTAIYAVPHIVDDRTVAWGMTEGRTISNLRENPNAAFIHQSPDNGTSGVRMTLLLTEIRESGDMLDAIKARAKKVSGPGAGEMVKYVGLFRVLETRPLM